MHTAAYFVRQIQRYFAIRSKGQCRAAVRFYVGKLRALRGH